MLDTHTIMKKMCAWKNIYASSLFETCEKTEVRDIRMRRREEPNGREKIERKKNKIKMNVCSAERKRSGTNLIDDDHVFDKPSIDYRNADRARGIETNEEKKMAFI